jgi:hypothetical protein
MLFRCDRKTDQELFIGASTVEEVISLPTQELELTFNLSGDSDLHFKGFVKEECYASHVSPVILLLNRSNKEWRSDYEHVSPDMRAQYLAQVSQLDKMPLGAVDDLSVPFRLSHGTSPNKILCRTISGHLIILQGDRPHNITSSRSTTRMWWLTVHNVHNRSSVSTRTLIFPTLTKWEPTVCPFTGVVIFGGIRNDRCPAWIASPRWSRMEPMGVIAGHRGLV